mgnify:CR=1 FL=1
MSLAGAITTGDVSQLPSRRDEDWRWTDLRGLLRSLPPAADPGKSEQPGPFSEIDADQRIEIVNGRGPEELILKGGEILELRFVATAGGSSVSRLKIYVSGGGALLLESYEAGAGAVMAIDLEFELDACTSIERVVISDCAGDAIVVSRAQANLAWVDASYAQTVLSNGSRRQRIETHVNLTKETRAHLDAAYINDGQRHSDITTVVTHSGVRGKTDQLTKGVVRDQARGVFQGRIVVERGADGTEARMGHHALILSDKAEVDAKPELLIFADDVQCAHGNTVGALDEAAIFYARQRGMPEAVARAMLTEAFVGEVVDRIEDEFARDVARAWVSAQLGMGE